MKSAWPTEEVLDAYVRDVAKLVSIPSVSDPSGGKEGAVQALVAERLRATGARVRVFEPSDIPAFFTHPLCHGPGRNYRGRPTVIAELGPADAPALLVMAHSDTVPVFDRAAWTFDPYSGDVVDGYIRGLGATDDKWGLATLLAVAEGFVRSGRRPEKRVIFASTIDEEAGVGNGMLLLLLAGIKAKTALYLDGYQMDILVGNLGGSNLMLRPKGAIDSAVMAAHADRLRELAASMSARRAPLFDRHPLYERNAMRDASVGVRFDPSSVERPLYLPFYTLPGESREGIQRELELEVARELGGDVSLYGMSYREPWFEPARTPSDTPLAVLLARSVHERLGREPVIGTVSKQDIFVMVNHARVPSVSFGCTSTITGRGAFHNPDERLAVREARDGMAIAWRTVWAWLGWE